MRFEVRTRQAPGRELGDNAPYELVIVTHESLDGKSRRSQVIPLTDADVVELSVVALAKVLEINGEDVSVGLIPSAD